MLKSEVKNLSRKEELPFPKLMISKLGKVILATMKSSDTEIAGYVVYSPSKEETILDAKCWSAEHFTDFYGSVILTQTPE